MKKFTIVTTCKGRLRHLQQTLPQFVKQADAEVVVVDYSCPERTAHWVRENYSGVAVVEVTGEPEFRASSARNAGARAAETPYLVFLDADTFIVDDFLDRAGPALEAGEFLRFKYSAGNDLNGACIMPRNSFLQVGGYDEVITSYGGGEQDLYWRLRRQGLRVKQLPAEGFCRPIRHDDHGRIAFQPQKDVRKAFMQVRAYRLCKEAILGVMFIPELPIAHRKELWRTVQEAIETGGNDLSVFVPYPTNKSDSLSDWETSRVVEVRLRRKAVQRGALPSSDF